MQKAFLECTTVELVYKSDEKSTASVRKGKSTTKVPCKLFGGSYTYKWTPALITQPPAPHCASGVKIQLDVNHSCIIFCIKSRIYSSVYIVEKCHTHGRNVIL